MYKISILFILLWLLGCAKVDTTETTNTLFGTWKQTEIYEGQTDTLFIDFLYNFDVKCYHLEIKEKDTIKDIINTNNFRVGSSHIYFGAKGFDFELDNKVLYINLLNEDSNKYTSNPYNKFTKVN